MGQKSYNILHPKSIKDEKVITKEWHTLTYILTHNTFDYGFKFYTAIEQIIFPLVLNGIYWIDDNGTVYIITLVFYYL